MANQIPRQLAEDDSDESQDDQLDIHQLRMALRNSELAVRESELRYFSTLNSLGDAIHVVDMDWRITFFNTAFTNWDEELGLHTDAIGKTVFELFPFLSDKIIKEYEQVAASGEILITEERTEVNGNVFITETRKIPIIRNGKVREIVTAVHNLTDIRHTEETLENCEQWLNRLSIQLLNAKEDERRRVSFELHDRLGQNLAAIKYRVEAALHEIRENEQTAIARTLEPVIDVVRKAIFEIRLIELDLQPPVLIDSGLEDAVGHLCDEFDNTYSGIQLNKSISIEIEKYPDYLKIAAYRILQEALTNVANHSNADNACISLTGTADSLKLSVSDNGSGFKVDDMLARSRAKRGLGLSSMSERATLSGGNFSIESGAATGTTVHVIWSGIPS
jgi:PAS domain S-box-containing protein